MGKKVSIIIPCKEIDEDIKKCIEGCLKLDYGNFEILVLTDTENKNIWGKKVKIIKAGKVLPAVKRNLGMEKAKGEFYAFIDSDAYPRKDWLKNALNYFSDEKIGIVGGPNLTPENAGFWEKVSGYTLASFFASGFASIRYKIAGNRFVRELPSCNYIARKKAVSKYPIDLLTAEDSKFCFDCWKKGFKVLYAGDVVVYHHRRKSFSSHIKQVYIYGRDIAVLAKREFSSWMIYYAILSLGIIGFILLFILSIFNYNIRIIFFYLLFVYSLIVLISSIKENLKISFAIFATTIITHFAYGVGFLVGLAKRNYE